MWVYMKGGRRLCSEDDGGVVGWGGVYVCFVAVGKAACLTPCQLPAESPYVLVGPRALSQCQPQVSVHCIQLGTGCERPSNAEGQVQEAMAVGALGLQKGHRPIPMGLFQAEKALREVEKGH